MSVTYFSWSFYEVNRGRLLTLSKSSAISFDTLNTHEAHGLCFIPLAGRRSWFIPSKHWYHALFVSLFLTLVGRPLADDHAPEADLLVHCSHLRHLNLDIRSNVLGGVSQGPIPRIDLTDLQTLNLRFLYPQSYTLHTPNLREISLRILFSYSPEQDTAAWSLIPQVPISVTHLTLELVVDGGYFEAYPSRYQLIIPSTITAPRSSPDEFPSFGDYPNNVEHLTLITKLDPIGPVRVHHRALDAIDSLFSNDRQRNLLDLRAVTLKLHIPCEFDVALEKLRPNAAWAALDSHWTALVDSGHLENLFFDLQFSDHYSDLPSNAQWERTLRISKFMDDCLPRLSRSGILKLTLNQYISPIHLIAPPRRLATEERLSLPAATAHGGATPPDGSAAPAS
ncbi:hypothetical protein ONZ45_g11897 [Pleurotus djamor]|nr:hypothetical protein ONZ45_g11897 [Pleurotus djamor]